MKFIGYILICFLLALKISSAQDDLRFTDFSEYDNPEPEIVQVKLFPDKQLETYICGYGNSPSFDIESEASDEDFDFTTNSIESQPSSYDCILLR